MVSFRLITQCWQKCQNLDAVLAPSDHPVQGPHLSLRAPPALGGVFRTLIWPNAKPVILRNDAARLGVRSFYFRGQGNASWNASISGAAATTPRRRGLPLNVRQGERLIVSRDDGRNAGRWQLRGARRYPLIAVISAP